MITHDILGSKVHVYRRENSAFLIIIIENLLDFWLDIGKTLQIGSMP